MRDNEDLSDNISMHDVHHYALIYIMVGIAGILVVVYVCQRYGCGKRARRAASPPAPAPAPRPEPRATPPSVLNECAQCGESGSAGVHKQSSECDEEMVVNERFYKNKGTTPVLRKIAFSEDSV